MWWWRTSRSRTETGMLPGSTKPQNKTSQNKLKFIRLFTLKNIITVMSIQLSCEQTCLGGKDNIAYFLFLFPCVFSSVSVINIITSHS